MQVVVWIINVNVRRIVSGSNIVYDAITENAVAGTDRSFDVEETHLSLLPYVKEVYGGWVKFLDR